jgi:DNA repair ATPase RecN
MRQRVTISYSIDLEDLPNEVGRLLESMFESVDQLQILCAMPSEVLSITTLDKISEMKNSIIAMDSQLTDIDALIRGYLNHASQLKQPIEDSADKLEQLDSLRQKIENLKRPHESTAQEPTQR